MVVDELTDEAVDEVFHALADSTRRDILRRCAGGEPSVSRLADAYPMSFAAVQKHVGPLFLGSRSLLTRRSAESAC
jgi:DNA-binding transcriptional ArsR family regulator